MNISADIAPLHEIAADVLVVVVFEGETPETVPLLREMDARTGGTISALITASELRGKLYETTYIHRPSQMAAKRLLVVGGGKPQKRTLDTIRRCAGTAGLFLRSKSARSIAFHCRSDWGLEKSAQAVVEGVLLALFDVNTYKTEEKENRFLEELIVFSEAGSVESLERGIERGKTLAKATNYARNLINEPASEMTPSELASQAADLAERFSLDVEILDEQQMRELAMGAILAVARGSDEPAKLIVLRYTPGADQEVSSEPIAFVGKGITFDSGGISLKKPEGMDRMKYDMAGGAAVLGALRALGQLRPNIPVIGVIPTTENMPSGRAQKPGDVIRSVSGKTIEVIDTDAEGRLILADAVAYARQLGAKMIVDLATLTGAVSVALGSVYAAVLGTDEQLVQDLMEAGKEAGEPLWQLPLDEAYREQLKSDIADIKNVGGRKAGTITGAYFIREFVGDVPWAHLDIAGTAWLDEKKPYMSAGPTGIGVRTLVYLAERLAQRDNA
ncbi:MAG: leucyl aminopeptidase [Acidobacteria bacterium]|nr:leucyl aminopeptidase [Acidobacteriota bacterium]